MNYRLLIEQNKNLKQLKWDQYYQYDGNFTVDNIEYYGELTSEEIDNVTNFLYNSENLLSTFGNQVTVRIGKNDYLEIEEKYDI